MDNDLYKKRQEKIITGEKSEIIKFGEGKGYITLSALFHKYNDVF